MYELKGLVIFLRIYKSWISKLSIHDFPFGPNLYYPTACIILLLNQLYSFTFTYSWIVLESRIKDICCLEWEKFTTLLSHILCMVLGSGNKNISLIICQYLANWKYRSFQVSSIVTSMVTGSSSCTQQQNPFQ